MSNYAKQDKETITVNAISERVLWGAICEFPIPRVFCTIPPFPWAAPRLYAYTTSPQTTILRALTVAYGSLPRVVPINLISTQQKEAAQQHTAVDLYLGSTIGLFSDKFLVCQAIVRHFVFIASRGINANTVFYAKFWIKITPDTYSNTALSSIEALCYVFCNKRGRRATALYFIATTEGHHLK